jgi:hypothetical protein
MPRPPNQPPDWTPWIVLCAVLLVILAGVFVFPSFQHYMAHEDCIGQGSTNC